MFTTIRSNTAHFFRAIATEPAVRNLGLSTLAGASLGGYAMYALNRDRTSGKGWRVAAGAAVGGWLGLRAGVSYFRPHMPPGFDIYV